MPSQIVNQFVQQASALAARAGIQMVVIIVRDPHLPNEPLVVASKGAIDNLRDIVAVKFNLGEPDDGSMTGWPSE